MRLNWKGKDLAENISVDQDTVSLWRTGKVNPPKVVLLYLSLLVKINEQNAYAVRVGGVSTSGERDRV